jgi:hypothetical protein
MKNNKEATRKCRKYEFLFGFETAYNLLNIELVSFIFTLFYIA